jgi:hypothetical protein
MSKCKGKTGATLKACKEQEKFMKQLKKKDSIFNAKNKAAMKTKNKYLKKYSTNNKNTVRTSQPLAPTQF